ncbi:hypothetical protein PACID_09030 [Acidipropionibacterium acidipropionici ATCC 4875]|uniref:Uncharacterized protein n=1 Tax=Acidipropionibacterium acidipropionici (strain ATCC 4875 / DSM 20272 / JCM 6432 / NBRC 12425 / NCIMB 8070 / 4) TaxID=1171373 RepID=K7SHJ8_ACIA4|nr:hypothetical protein PACID_09030 [Acidipropionibacterium acidipropionici ATCC 4875]
MLPDSRSIEVPSKSSGPGHRIVAAALTVHDDRSYPQHH